MMDISENLFLAVDEIIKRRLESVNYDTTIICTIKDNSNAAKNEYTCSNGSAEFKAYSADTTFKIDESVQVMIPNNDYSRQKIIIGRYVAEDGVPFSYTDPFDGLIDVSGNLIDKVEYNKDGYTSLLANHPERKDIVLWTKEFTLPQTKFDLVGVQGYFHTRLGSLDPKYGSYGYRLDIVSQAEKTVAEETKQENDETKLQDITTTFYLDSSDMFGNVYNFQTYIKQEEVYNISNLNKIKKMTLTFYQQPGSFMTDADVTIPYGNEHGDFLDNLFTKDPYVCLGYDLSKFDQEQAILYTINNETYIFDGKDPAYELETNRKTVNLRWLHEYDDGIKVVNNLEGLKDYDIRWYRYRFGASPADQYCGVYWDRVSAETIDKDNGEYFDNFIYTFNPKPNTQTEQIKVIIISPNKELIQSNIMIFTNEGEVVSGATADKTNGLSIWCKDNSEGNYFLYGQNNNLLDLSQANLVRTFEAQFGNEAITIDSDTKKPQLKEANKITWKFPFPLSKTMFMADNFDYSFKSKLLKAFEYDENKKEVIACKIKYQYADKTERIIDYYRCLNIIYNEDKTIKDFIINYKALYEEYEENGEKKITDETGELFKKNINNEKDKKEKAYFRIIVNDDKEQSETINIIRNRYENKPDDADDNWEAKVASDYLIDPLQNYTIKTTYNSSALQNNIECVIEKNNVPYSTGKKLQFGIMGTNGTDTTVVITFDYDKPALTAGQPIKMFPVHANIYDYSHNEIDFTKEDYSDIECHWEWAWKDYKLDSEKQMNPQEIKIIQRLDYDNNGELIKDNEGNPKVITPDLEMNECFLDLQNVDLNIIQNHFLVLKLTVKNWGNYNLIAYKAIPIRASEEYAMLIGPTEVVYGSTGYADYFKDPYQLKDKNYNTVECDWTLYNPLNNTDDDNDIGKVEKGILKPATMYFKDGKPYGVIATPYIEVKEYDNKVKEYYYKELKIINTETNEKRYQYSLISIINETSFKEQLKTKKSLYKKLDIKNNLWIQPLVIVQNNYPSGMLNEWDGKSIVLNEDEGQFLAPVIAAGRKNSDNTFSGIMLGDFAKAEGTFTGTGLYGFDDGQLSFGFMEDGNAFIGKNGSGQILFDGENSTIMSAGYKDGKGMKIDLINNTIHAINGFTLETDTIYFSDDTLASTFIDKDSISVSVDAVLNLNDNFMVSDKGKLYATGAYIKGDIYADYIEANDGIIGGWTLSSNGFTSPDETIFLYSTSSGDELSIQVGSNFNVTANGIITAYEGTLGGWTLTKNKLKGKSYGDISFFTNCDEPQAIGTSGVIDTWRIIVGSTFGINSSGNLYTQGEIHSKGDIYIEGGNQKLYFGDAYLYNPASDTSNLALYAPGRISFSGSDYGFDSVIFTEDQMDILLAAAESWGDRATAEKTAKYAYFA